MCHTYSPIYFHIMHRLTSQLHAMKYQQHKNNFFDMFSISAVYIYNLKNLPYTVIIRMNDSTVINNHPISVTAHNGILSKNPQSSMVVTISAGKVVCSGVPNPAAFIMVEIVPSLIWTKGYENIGVQGVQTR